MQTQARRHAGTPPSSLRLSAPFSFRSDSSWCEVTTCYQLLFLSACIMWKCLRLQDSQTPPPPPPLPPLPNPHRVGKMKKKKSRVDLQLSGLLNSSDCPGGKECIFFYLFFNPPLPSQQEQEAHPSPNNMRFLFSRIQGWVGRPQGTNTGLGMSGRVVTDTFCDSIVLPVLVGGGGGAKPG